MSSSHQALQKAVFRLLKPLVRILLRNGIPFKAFAELAKQAYVEVAASDFKVAGKRQTDARISTITGLTRKDVARLKNQTGEDESDNIARYHRAARVVYGWVHDPDYQQNGQSRVLSFDEGHSNFTSLVKKYSGDVTPRAILDELSAVGVVAKEEDGRIRLLQRAYIPGASRSGKLALLGHDVGGLLSTMDRNIYTDEEPFFQRKVYYDNLPEEALPLIRQLIEKDAQALLEQMDRFICQHDRDANPQAQGSGRKGAGIGIYYFEDDPEEPHS